MKEKKENNKIRIKIRKLRGSHEANQCARLMVSSEPWITLCRTYNEAMKILRDPSREVYLAVIKDEIVGFVIFLMRGALTGYIQTVCVKPEWRNREIGSRLLKFAEDKILKKTPNVFMCVSSFNKDAQRLYKRLGYEIIGEMKDYIVPGHSEILLRKSIAPLIEFKRRS
jgi:ribosomal-protein-alanine N-acetyltransferase